APPPAAQPAAPAAAPRVGPAARNLAEAHGLDLAGIPGSGPGGRVTKEDVLKKVGTSAAPAAPTQEALPLREAPAPAPEPAPAAAPADAARPAPAEPPRPEPAPQPVAAQPAPDAGGRPERRVPMTRLRRRAAVRLLAAQRENAILTTFNEVNMEPVMSLRNRYKDEFERAHGVRLGFMSFFTKAAVEALKKF